ncbi:MAG: DUF3084 domain-containing protein [Fimbriimonadales bacterium]
MDLLSFGFIGLVVLLGGLVAYLADGLGRKLGKKRLSLFGMRPRHTATALTVGAGVLIPLLTVLTLSVASSEFRQWVTEGRAAIRESKILSERVSGLRTEIEKKTQQANGLDEKLKGAQKRLQELESQVKESLDAAKLAEQRTRVAQAKSDRLDREVARQRASLDKVSASLVVAQSALEETRKASAELARSFKLQQDDLKAAYDQNKKLTDENLGLDASNNKLRTEIAEFQNKLTDLNSRIERAQQDLAAAQAETQRVQGELAVKNEQLTDLQGILESTRQGLEINLGNSRTRPMIFGMNEEIARLPLPRTQPQHEGEALAAVRRVQLQASSAADTRGARPVPGGTLSAGIFSRKADDGRVITIEENRRRPFHQAMAGQRDELVLIAYSALNAFQGEFVALTLRPYRNPMLYRTGETVVEGRIDGSQSDNTIYNQITAFLEQQVTNAALAKGMIPGRAPKAGQPGSTRLGVLSLVKQISEFGRPIRIVAYAAEDTRAADPLRLDFKFR